MSEETASQRPHRPPGVLSVSGGGQGLAPYTPLPSRWDTQEASLYVSDTVGCLLGGRGFVEKSKATSCPIRGPGSHDPPCPAPARAAQAPSPSVGGRTFVPSGASVLCAGPDCPFSYHRKRAAGPDPHHDHPFLDPDSSPSDHRGRVARTQPTRGRRSSSSFVCREPMRRRPFLSVVRPDR